MRVRNLLAAKGSAGAWAEAVALANHRLNFQQTNMLASVVGDAFRSPPEHALSATPERLAVLSSSTTTHLLPSLRIGALRRGLWLDIYENAYGLYRQELLDRESVLHAFAPTSALFCLDADHVAAGASECRNREEAKARAERFVDDLSALWRLAAERFECKIFQQAIMPRALPTIGSNEHRHPASAAAFVALMNHKLRDACDVSGADLLAIDARIAADGLAAWHSPVFWFKAKQEIALTAAPMFGDLLGRLIAARRGRVAKCCVFDLDNTLWGGVVGDDGPEGIVIGQGSAQGEAFVVVQKYALELRRRGIILAICSKNDESVARAAFERNPEMILKTDYFGCFIANWDDKVTNLREIARRLNIGVDALAFVDDNPFERELVRRELPMVSTPELPAEPELYPACLADAGYFESVALTQEDFARASFYDPGRAPPPEAASVTDLAAYLASLDMTLAWGPVDDSNMERTVQLINKTNQFNLTTQRHSEQDVRAMMAHPSWRCFQFRLIDRFGDNGLISVIILRATEEDAMEIESWLMSCRVLGRQVEEAALNVIAENAKRAGVHRLIGVYRPTSKNAMVMLHYEKLGFRFVAQTEEETRMELDLDAFSPRETVLKISEVQK